MNLLDANDRSGQYPDSWYAATAQPLPPCEPLRERRRVSVCVIGAGYTGLSAALHLAEAGVDVVVLEAQRIGFGASGRNGGQLGSGQRQDQITLEKMIGADAARVMWNLGQDAKRLVRDLVARHNIDCYLKSGVAWAASKDADVRDLHSYAQHMSRVYGYGDIEPLDRAAFHALCPSPDYRGGVLDHGAAHLHPLRLALGLARAAQASGAILHESSRVHDIREGKTIKILTDSGEVEADHLIIGANGYLGGLNRQVAARVMPINNFVAATEPLGDRARQVLTQDIAVADSRFVVNYFRLSHDGRLLFGGGESYGYRFPRDIRSVVRKPMRLVFPQLADVAMDYAWGGTLAITMKRLPHLARLAPNILSAGGYSGHGVGNAVQAGKLMAQALQGPSAGFDAFTRLPVPAFPGGSALRSPLLVLAMTWFAMRDRLGI